MQGQRGMAGLRDPTGLSPGFLQLSPAALFIVSLMDGTRNRLDIQEQYMRRFGQLLFSEELDKLIEGLEQLHFLEGPGLEALRAKLRSDYAASPYRPLRDARALAPDGEDPDELLDEMLAAADVPSAPIAGLLAPHLDYPRGAPCYAPAYRNLAARSNATRFVVLGTNHAGESSSIVGTRKDFETPWGVVPHDADFMRAMDRSCGTDLCEGEHDHAREHSIELQVVLLKKVLGDRPFTIAPYLCPDICGPTGTAPAGGRGADLRDVARALRDLASSDGVPTCIVAGADLSHVGAFFGDRRRVDEAYLEEVRSRDLRALAAIEAGDPEAFREEVESDGNRTRICSAASIFLLATALRDLATPRLLGYHQAVTPEIQNCVTCAAMDFVLPSR